MSGSYKGPIIHDKAVFYGNIGPEGKIRIDIIVQVIESSSAGNG